MDMDGIIHSFRDISNYPSSESSSSRYLEWLKYISSLNISEDTGSKFWINKSKKEGFTTDDIHQAKNIEDLLSILGEADYSLLMNEDGYNEWYKPKILKDDIGLYRSDSSGTTGPAKTVYHDTISLLFSAMNEFVGIKSRGVDLYENDKFLLAFGPIGAYQKEHEYLAKLLGLKYVNLSFDTKGLKNASQQEIFMRIYPRVEEARKYLSKDNVGLITLSKEAIPMLKDVLDKADMIKISGTGITYDQIKLLEEEFPSPLIVPSYGHFAAKSSIGFLDEENKGITYYPSFYVTNFVVVDENGKLVPYGGEGTIKMIIAQSSVLLIKGDDRAYRRKPNGIFNIDGVGDPHR